MNQPKRIQIATTHHLKVLTQSPLMVRLRAKSLTTKRAKKNKSVGRPHFGWIVPKSKVELGRWQNEITTKCWVLAKKLALMRLRRLTGGWRLSITRIEVVAKRSLKRSMKPTKFLKIPRNAAGMINLGMLE